jgi:catechol 2,3-dioxygenase-like lactoylglutathione lyase family enzyme
MNRHINQVALVVSDLKRSTECYASAFGMDNIFGTAEFRGPGVDRVQGMVNVASSTRWLIDDREFFQLEIFEFENPKSTPLPADHGVSHEGYNRVIVAVKSLEQVSAAAVSAGGTVSALLCGQEPDHPAHALLKDPDGILLELVEDPGLVPGDRPAKIIGLGLTSLDLATTVEDMCEGFGFTPCEDRFQHRIFWGEGGRLDRLQTLYLDDMYLVVSQYQDSRPRSSDHCLGDIGVMNFAIGFPDAGDFDNCFQKTQQMGMQSNVEPIIVKDTAAVTYNNDRQGFSVEMIYLARKLWGLYGFAPPSLKDRMMNKLVNWKARRAYRQHIQEAHPPSRSMTE